MSRKLPRKPSARTVKQFGLYNIGGMAFFVTGYAVFSLLYGLFGWQWWLAKIIADLCGWSINFLVQRFLAFRHESQQYTNRALFVRFSVISIANVPLDYAIVGGLKWLGVSPFIGLFVSAGFFTIWKFIWYKWWVFRHPAG
jgi:putative flippase GtrA